MNYVPAAANQHPTTLVIPSEIEGSRYLPVPAMLPEQARTRILRG